MCSQPFDTLHWITISYLDFRRKFKLLVNIAKMISFFGIDFVRHFVTIFLGSVIMPRAILGPEQRNDIPYLRRWEIEKLLLKI